MATNTSDDSAKKQQAAADYWKSIPTIMPVEKYEHVLCVNKGPDNRQTRYVVTYTDYQRSDGSDGRSFVGISHQYYNAGTDQWVSMKFGHVGLPMDAWHALVANVTQMDETIRMFSGNHSAAAAAAGEQ